jgi:hypothetical protein
MRSGRKPPTRCSDYLVERLGNYVLDNGAGSEVEKVDRIERAGDGVPCLIRRAAIEHAWGAGHDPTGYRIENLRERAWDSSKSEGQQIRAYEFALSRLRERPDIAPVLIHKPGPLIEDLDKLDRLTRVYRKAWRRSERC